MKQRKTYGGIAARLRTLRSQKNLSVQQMANRLGIGPNGYRKYERALYNPPLHIQILLAEQFGISLDWLIFDKGPMYFSEIETALRENKLKQDESQLPVKTVEKTDSSIPPDAMMVTTPEIKELLRFMDENPVFKFQLLTQFYRYKQDGPQAGEIQLSK